MPTGKVSHYDAARGFGFIVRDDGGADVFVHAKHLMNVDLLKRDQQVSFELVMDQRRGKARADRVRVIDGAGRLAGRFDPIAHDNHFLLNVD